MSSRSASALLDAALAVPFDPEEEDRRQLALARSATWDSGPMPDQQLDIAPEPAFVPDPLVAEADAAMGLPPAQVSDGLEPPLPMEDGGSGGPALPQADEDLPPVMGAPAGASVGVGGGSPRRSASALLADIPDAAVDVENVRGPVIDLPRAEGPLDAIGNAIKRGLTMNRMGRAFEEEAPNADRVLELQQVMREAPASAEFQAAMNDDLTPQESWQAFKAAPVKVMGELLAESFSAFLPQMFEKAPARIAVGAGLGGGTALAAGQAGPQVALPEEVITVPAGIAIGARAGYAEAAGAASYTLEMAGGILEGLEQAGVPMDNPQALREALADPERMQLAREFAMKKAVPVAAFDAASALIAGRLAGKRDLSRVQKILRGAGETLIQSFMGAGGEAAGQLAQKGEITSVRSVMAEGLAETATGGVDIAAGMAFDRGETSAMATGQGRSASAMLDAALSEPAPATQGPPDTAPNAGPSAPAARVVVEADDVFGEPTTTAVEEAAAPSPVGDERFAPPVVEQPMAAAEPAAAPVTEAERTAGPAVPTETAAPAAAQQARQRIKNMTSQSGAIDVSILEDIVQYGSTVYRAGMDYATWAATMVREFGQGVAQFLRQAFDRIVAAYRDSRFADTTGAVGDVRPRQTKPRQLEEKAMRNEALAAETRARLGSEYLPISLNAQAEAAKEWINTNGLDAAKLRIAQLSGEDSVPTPLDFAIGIEAAGRLSAVGDHQGAADIVSTMSHRATGMGQTISTLAMMARLSPEGIVFYGENIIKRYINALPPEAQDRIRALQAEVARLKAELAQAKFDQGSEVIRSGKLGDEKIQDRIKRRQRAKVTADLGPAASGPEVTAETRARVISMNRAVRDVLLGDATKAEATKAIEAILLEQGNLSASEAAAMAKSIADAFFKLMRETRTRLTNEARTKALPTKARGFEKLLELLRSGKDVSDAEFTGNVAQLLGLPGMTREMARDLQAIAKRYERSTDPDVRLVLAAQMFEKAYEMVPADIWSKVRAFAYLAMLFAPKTWIKNILGNEILWVAHIGRDAFISGILDPAMSLLTGKRTMSGVYFAKRTRALLTPFEDVRKGYLWSKQENPTFNFRQNLAVGVNHLRSLSKLTSQNKFEIADVRNVGGRIFSSKFMRFWENGLSIALGAGDRAFWMAQFRVSLAQMQAAAEKNGTWSGQPTPEMLEAAYAEAAYSIFQNPNVVSKGLNYIRKGLNWMSTWGRSTEFGLGTGLLAFTQVPGSITLRGLVDWSPLGFIQAAYTGMRGILYASSKGRMGAKFDQAAFNKEFTQALLGTGSLYLAGAWLYSLGIITASREDDDDLEAFRRASGTGAYRINVTAMRRALLSGNWFTPQEGELGDLVVPYDWAQPLAITLAAGAELAAQKERAGREELKKGAGKQESMASTIVKLSGTKSLEELPLLSGLSSFMKAWGYGGAVDAVASTVAGMPAMFVPQAVRQWMQIKDNMQRETSAGDPVKREFMKVLASMPGYSTKFPLKFDTMGQAIERYQYGGNNVFNVMLNPAVSREIKMSPVMQEISRLVDATGQTGMVPKKVERTATLNGEKVDLTNNQIATYQYYLGNFTMAHFTWRMAAPVYARLPDEVKVKMLTDDIQDIDAAVKSAVLGHDMRRLTRKQLFLRNALVNSPLGRSVPPR